MSLTEIKNAVGELSPEEVAELAAFMREHESKVWDRQIDADFGEDGRLRRVLDEVRADLRDGRVGDLP
jgi:hypothetical protein